MYYDVIFPNEPNEAGKAILAGLVEAPKNAGGTYWHGVVHEDNYDHADMPANMHDPDEGFAKNIYNKPNPKGGDDIPVHTFGVKRMRSKAQEGNIHPLKLEKIKKPKKS